MKKGLISMGLKQSDQYSFIVIQIGNIKIISVYAEEFIPYPALFTENCRLVL